MSTNNKGNIGVRNNKKLKIAVDCFPLADEKFVGIPMVVANVLTELQKIDRVNEYYLLFKCKNNVIKINNDNWSVVKKFTVSVNLREKLNNLKNANLMTRLKKKTYKVIITVSDVIGQIFLPFWLFRNKIDLYIATSSDYPLPTFLGKHRVIMFVYDLVWEYYPETMEWKNRMRMRLFAKKNLHSAHHVLAISESTMADLTTIMKLNKPVSTITLGANDSVFFPASKQMIEEVKRKYGIKKKYILSVCTIEPRKNIGALIKAFSILNPDDCMLVLTGKTGWISRTFFQEIETCRIKDKLIFTGYVPDEDLAPLYSGAEIFVYPSIYEGFGLPVLEAMKSGCPVITSIFSALPEVIGNAGIAVETTDIGLLAKTIKSLLRNDKMRKSLRRMGLRRAKLFTWDRTARQLLDAIQTQKKLMQ